MAKRKADQQSRVERIDRELVAARNEQREVERKFREKSLAVVDAPGDKALAEEVGSLRDERDTIRARIESLHAAKAEAQRRDTVEAQRAEVSRLRNNVNVVSELADEWARASLEARDLANQLANKRAEVARHAAKMREVAWDTLRCSCGQALAERRAGAALSMVTTGLADAGVAAQLANRVDGTLVSAATVDWARPLGESLERARHRLVAVIEQAVEEHAAQLSAEEA